MSIAPIRRVFPLLLLGACGPTEVEPELCAALQQIRFAPPQPGVGLGDLRLGVTTVAECATRYGDGTARLSEHPAPTLKLDLADGRLRLHFAIDRPTGREASSSSKERLTHFADSILTEVEVRSIPGTERYHFGRYAGRLELTGSADDIVMALGEPATMPSQDRDEFVLGYPGIGFWCRRIRAGLPARVERIVLWQPLPAAPR